MEEFRSPVSGKQRCNCQSFGHSAKTGKSKQKCLICGKNHSQKDVQIEKQGNHNVPTVRGYMLHLTKGVRNAKSRHSGNMWLITKKHASIVNLNTLALPRTLKQKCRVVSCRVVSCRVVSSKTIFMLYLIKWFYHSTLVLPCLCKTVLNFLLLLSV